MKYLESQNFHEIFDTDSEYVAYTKIWIIFLVAVTDNLENNARNKISFRTLKKQYSYKYYTPDNLVIVIKSEA